MFVDLPNTPGITQRNALNCNKTSVLAEPCVKLIKIKLNCSNCCCCVCCCCRCCCCCVLPFVVFVVRALFVAPHVLLSNPLSPLSHSPLIPLTKPTQTRRNNDNKTDNTDNEINNNNTIKINNYAIDKSKNTMGKSKVTNTFTIAIQTSEEHNATRHHTHTHTHFVGGCIDQGDSYTYTNLNLGYSLTNQTGTLSFSVARRHILQRLPALRFAKPPETGGCGN